MFLFLLMGGTVFLSYQLFGLVVEFVVSLQIWVLLLRCGPLRYREPQDPRRTIFYYSFNFSVCDWSVHALYFFLVLCYSSSTDSAHLPQRFRPGLWPMNWASSSCGMWGGWGGGGRKGKKKEEKKRQREKKKKKQNNNNNNKNTNP